MAENRQDFDRRVHQLIRKHKAVSRGHSVVMSTDGLIHVQPRRRLPRLPIGMLAVILGVMVLFKSTLVAHLGEAAYTDRLTSLTEGSMPERAGAWAMQIDPATRALAPHIRTLLP